MYHASFPLMSVGPAPSSSGVYREQVLKNPAVVQVLMRIGWSLYSWPGWLDFTSNFGSQIDVFKKLLVTSISESAASFRKSQIPWLRNCLEVVPGQCLVAFRAERGKGPFLILQSYIIVAYQLYIPGAHTTDDPSYTHGYIVV